MRVSRLKPAVLVAPLLLGGCLFRILPNRGGGLAEFEPPREVRAEDVALLPGYRIAPVATGLTFPTGVAFDERGGVYVVEAGYSYGEVVTTPRLLRVEASGALTEIARGDDPPWNGVDYRDGAFFIAGGHVGPGRVLRVGMDGTVRALVDALPSYGDHHTNGPVVGPDGWIYFGQGTATNAGVVGLDNADFGWLAQHPDFHDTPCRDVRLTGENFTTPNPLTADPDDRVVTGAYVPFGTRTEPGQVIRGSTRCGGAVMRVRPDGSGLEVVAWGLRNPFGLAFSPDGRLFVTENQFDVRGSRPVFGTGDLLWEIRPGTWYGWPDYFAGRPITDDWFHAPGKRGPRMLLLDHPGAPPKPAAVLPVHASSDGIDFSRSAAFGHVGDAFIAEFGDMSPGVGKILAAVGFRVVRVDVKDGTVHEFAVNRGKGNAPASRLERGGLERPVAVRFDPAGTALYIVDFGVMTTVDGKPRPRPGTGVLWKITRDAGGRP
jgi:glucose/arabinose dehydrogenase